MSDFNPAKPPLPDPYATPEPTPYNPEEWAEPQGPPNTTPATTEVLLTVDEAHAQAAEELELESVPVPTEPPMLTAYKATLNEEDSHG